MNNKNLFASKTFTKMILSYLLVVFITIVMISSIIYYKFSNATIQDIQINTQEKLKQNMNQLDFMRNQVNALGLQLIDDNYIVALIYRKNSNPSINYLAQTKLKQVVDANPMISSIYAYNGNTKKYVSNLSSSDSSGSSLDQEMELEVKTYEDKNRMKFIPLAFLNKASNGNEYKEKIISIVFNDYPNLTTIKANKDINVLNSMLIINFKAGYIQKFLTSLSDTRNSDTMIVNRNGDVICNSNLENFGRNISKDSYFRDILNSNKSDGYITKNSADGQFLITYVASDNSPYLFINKTNYSVLLQKIHALLYTVIMVCLLILLLCIIISILAAYNVYLPFYKTINNIKGQMPEIIEKKFHGNSYNEIEELKDLFSNIIDKTNQLETSILYNEPFIKKVFLKLLLEGDTAALSNIAKKTSEIRLKIRDDESVVILFSIDRYAELAKLQDKLTESLLVAQIENIIDDTLSCDFEIELVYLEQDLITVIANTHNEENFDEKLKSRIKLIQGAIFQKYGITITVAIGGIVENVNKLYVSYSNCLELLKYRFVYGYEALLDNLPLHEVTTNKVTDIDKNKRKIIKNIKECNTKEFEEEIHQIFMKLSDNKYDYIKLTINQLAFDIVKELTVLNASDSNEEEINRIYSQINDFETMETLKAWLIQFCRNVVNKLECKKLTRHRDTIDLIVTYLEANYFKPEISTESVSEIVKLTPGYLGKLFSESIGKSINEYINELRMKRAKEELEKSTACVCDIANLVGFSNQSYFTATFKKHFGVTPNQYRLEHTKMNSFKINSSKEEQC